MPERDVSDLPPIRASRTPIFPICRSLPLLLGTLSMRTPLGRPSARRPDRSRSRPAPAPRRPRGPWKNGPIPVIGLIGGMGAGKSRVAAILSETGAQVLDADVVGHALLDQTPSRDEVVEHFGPEVLERDGSGIPVEPQKINRAILGKIVFTDTASRKALEAILHPRMLQTFEKAISRAVRRSQSKAIVLDAAVLLEAKWHTLCDVIVFVDAPADVRLARLEASRGWTAETLAAREAAQHPLNDKQKRADFVVENNADDAALIAKVNSLWDKLARRPAAKPPAKRGDSNPAPNLPS